MNSPMSFQDQDDEDNFHEEDDRMEVFSRRKLESNWDRYAESEKEEPTDDTPAHRGTDYHVLLESAGKIRPQKTARICFFLPTKTVETSLASAGEQTHILELHKNGNTTLIHSVL